MPGRLPRKPKRGDKPELANEGAAGQSNPRGAVRHGGGKDSGSFLQRVLTRVTRKSAESKRSSRRKTRNGRGHAPRHGMGSVLIIATFSRGSIFTYGNFSTGYDVSRTAIAHLCFRRVAAVGGGKGKAPLVVGGSVLYLSSKVSSVPKSPTIKGGEPIRGRTSTGVNFLSHRILRPRSLKTLPRGARHMGSFGRASTLGCASVPGGGVSMQNGFRPNWLKAVLGVFSSKNAGPVPPRAKSGRTPHECEERMVLQKSAAGWANKLRTVGWAGGTGVWIDENRVDRGRGSLGIKAGGTAWMS